MTAVPRWLGWVWFVLGVAGAIGAVALGAFGFAFVGSASAAGLDAIGVTRDLVDSVTETVDAVEVTLDSASEGLDTMQDSLADGAGSLIELSALAENIGTVVTVDIPATIGSLRDGMPQLIRTASVIDSTMSALSFVGVDYDPDAPLDQSLERLDQQLAAIPESLEAQSEGFDAAADGIADFGRASFSIASDIGELRRNLRESRDLVAGYDTVIAEAIPVLDGLESQLESQASSARVAIVILALVMIAVQSVPIGLGWWVLRESRQ